MVTSLLYGLYAGAVSIALTLLAYSTGFWKSDSNTWLSYVAWAFLILFIYLATRERKREDFGGTMTYGQGVATGALVGLFAGLLVGIFMWVYLTNINPEFIDFIVQQRETIMHASKQMTAAQVDQAIDLTHKLFVPIAVVSAIFGNVVLATLAALIVSIFVRTKEGEVVQVSE
jgi:hypothetical protein